MDVRSSGSVGAPGPSVAHDERPWDGGRDVAGLHRAATLLQLQDEPNDLVGDDEREQAARQQAKEQDPQHGRHVLGRVGVKTQRP